MYIFHTDANIVTSVRFVLIWFILSFKHLRLAGHLNAYIIYERNRIIIYSNILHMRKFTSLQEKRWKFSFEDITCMIGIWFPCTLLPSVIQLLNEFKIY